jgi:tetratricopeptide (TPR) repeat protein
VAGLEHRDKRERGRRSGLFACGATPAGPILRAFRERTTPYDWPVDARAAESLLNFAERAGSGLKGLDAKALSGQLEERYGDLLAAMQWFLDQGRSDETIRLAISLADFWSATERLDEGSEWFDRALNSPGGEDVHRGQACFEAGFLAYLMGDDDRASALHSRALEIGRQIGDPTITALALTGLGRIALRSDVAEARRLCREALAVTEGTADRFGRSNAIHVLGVAAQMAGDLLEARELMTERMALARELGSYAGISSEAGNLSVVERQLGNLGRADALAREGLEIDQRREDEWAFPYKLNALAAVATARGEFDRAATLLGAAEAMMEAQGAAWPPDERPHYERTVATLTEAMGSAEFDRARAVGSSMASREAVDFALGAGSAQSDLTISPPSGMPGVPPQAPESDSRK